MLGTAVKSNDLLLNITGGSIGRCAVVPAEFDTGNVSQHVCIIRPILCSSRYIHAYIISDLFWDSMELTGSGREGLPKYNLEQMFLPLPPLEEQDRIITELGKWDIVIETINESLKNLSNNIKSAKSYILDLAMQGKLVEQDPTDEPAAEMLRRINPKAKIITDNPHYPQLPDNWVLTNIGSVCNYGHCESVNVEEISSDNWILELEDIEKESGNILVRHTKQSRTVSGLRNRFNKSNVLYSKLRTYLNKVLLAPDDGFCTAEIIPITAYDCIMPEYLCAWLRSPYFMSYTLQCGYGVKMPRLSTTDVRNGIVPLPPLKEQIRIIGQINNIFNTLSDIELSI